MSLLETKAAGRSPEFDGDAKHWEEWNFKFVTWIGLLGNPGEGTRIQQQLDEIARDPAVVTPLLDMGEVTQNQSRVIYNVLAQTCMGQGGEHD